MDDKHIAKIAEQHIRRSLDEAENIDMRERWANGMRAEQQALAIVTQVLALYEAKLLTTEDTNGR